MSSLLGGPWAHWERQVSVKDAIGMKQEFPVLQNLEDRPWAFVTAGCWVGWWPEHCSSPCPKCDMQKLTVDELKRLLYDTFCEHLSMKDIENIIMTEEESHLGTAEECPVDVESE